MVHWIGLGKYRDYFVFCFMHKLHRLKYVNSINISLFKLREGGSDDEVLDYLNIMRKVGFFYFELSSV